MHNRRPIVPSANVPSAGDIGAGDIGAGDIWRWGHLALGTFCAGDTGAGEIGAGDIGAGDIGAGDWATSGDFREIGASGHKSSDDLAISRKTWIRSRLCRPATACSVFFESDQGFPGMQRLAHVF